MNTSLNPGSVGTKIITELGTGDVTPCVTDSPYANKEELLCQKSRTEANIRRSKNHEAVATLLSSFGQDAEDCSENFAKQEISFKDLASLTREDLTLLGITDPDKQEEILETFNELPKQNFSYESVAQCEDAQVYNKEILRNTFSHVNTVKTAMSATNVKLKIKPSRDVIMEERNFASKFVLEALEELKKITEEIEDRLSALEEMTRERTDGRGIKLYETAVIIGLAASLAIWYLRFR